MPQDADKQAAGDMFTDIRDDNVKFSPRIGKLTDSVSTKPRPFKISFQNTTAREHLFDKARNLPKSSNKSISICPELTNQQRAEDKELMEEMEKLNIENEDLNWEYRCLRRQGEKTIAGPRQTTSTTHNPQGTGTTSSRNSQGPNQ